VILSYLLIKTVTMINPEFVLQRKYIIFTTPLAIIPKEKESNQREILFIRMVLCIFSASHRLFTANDTERLLPVLTTGYGIF